MTDLTPDEKTVLLIASQGEPMIPIGKWKKPVESLAKKGLLKAHKHPGDPSGHFNHRITPEGRAAVEEAEREDDAAIGHLITASTAVGHEQRKARAHAEQIAVQLVDLAEASAAVTGDSKQMALREWARVVLERALEMMGG